MLDNLAITFFIAGIAERSFALSEPKAFLTALLLSYLPDIDVLFQRKHDRGGKFAHTHRSSLFHAPLIYIPLGALIFLVAGGGKSLLILFILASFMHFFADSVGIGYGVQWCYPFGKRFYKLFADEKTGYPSRRLVSSWDRSEQAEMAARHGSDRWIREVYFRPTVILLWEGTLLISSLLYFFFAKR